MRALGFLVALAACQGTPRFECETDAACDSGAGGGFCEATGFCSFADATCASGRRYGGYAAEELASRCVAPGEAIVVVEAPDATVPSAPDAEIDPLPSLSDDFSAPTLSGWQVVNPQLAGSSIVDGALVVEPTAEVIWYERATGFLLFKRVDGDFRARARIRARRMSSPSEDVWANLHFGGLLARDGGAAAESYLAIFIGKDDDVSVETKNTIAGATAFAGPSWPAAEAELAICRLGSRVLLLKRPLAGGTWAIAADHDRPDLGRELQVGPAILAAGTQRDLRAVFDEVLFERVASEADCLR